VYRFFRNEESADLFAYPKMFFTFVDAMKAKEITDGFRVKVNNYLNKHYGASLPTTEKYLIVEKNHYLYLDEENDNCFYIPKEEVDI